VAESLGDYLTLGQLYSAVSNRSVRLKDFAESNCSFLIEVFEILEFIHDY
jgi:hypothetical protein